MKYIKINPEVVSREEISLAIEYLVAGKIVLLPSDTVYGLSVRADQARVIKKLRDFKGRPKNKPLLILVSSFEMLKKYFAVSIEQKIYLKKIWRRSSRPTTVILRDKGLLPNNLNPEEDGLAVRLPKSDFLIKIIKGLGVPLVSTSANLHGLKPMNNISKLTASLGPKKPQLTIDGGHYERTRTSKLIDLRGYPQIKIIRK